MVYTGSILYRKVLSPTYDKLVMIFPDSVHPNHITLMGGLFAALSNLAIYNDWRWSAFILFTLYHVFDNMDGKHARRTKQTSEFGAILDHFVDGTIGIWAGAVGCQFGLSVDPSLLVVCVFWFTVLFEIVHGVHAFSGFFELGGEYLSIDEVFWFLSLVRLLHALDLKNIPLLQSPLFHLFFMYMTIAMCGMWLYQHGNKVKLDQLKKKPFVIISFVLYVGITWMGLIQWCQVEHYVLPLLLAFAVPYGLVLWESKDKH